MESSNSIDDYPDVVAHEIAKRLDYRTIQSMKLASRHLYSALSDSLLWIDLCERDNIALPSREFRRNLAEQARNSQDETCVGQLDFERVWIKNPFRPNLVPPTLPSFAEMERAYGWKFSSSGMSIGRSDMKVEEPPAGSEPHPEIVRCFATSYTWGQKLVTIDLIKEGVPKWMLDHLRPRIIVSELVAPRYDCASEYHMHAQLLQDQELFDTRVQLPNRFKVEKREWPQWTNPARWERVEIVFEDYPVGMRSISVLSQGKDKQFWAGSFGSKFANLQISIELTDGVRWLGEAEFPDGKKEYSVGGRFDGPPNYPREVDYEDDYSDDDSDDSAYNH